MTDADAYLARERFEGARSALTGAASTLAVPLWALISLWAAFFVWAAIVTVWLVLTVVARRTFRRIGPRASFEEVPGRAPGRRPMNKT